MASNVTMTVYLGSGMNGIGLENEIVKASTFRNMNKSEFAVFSMKEQIKRDRKLHLVQKKDQGRDF